jgi:hypothetical protein
MATLGLIVVGVVVSLVSGILIPAVLLRALLAGRPGDELQESEGELPCSPGGDANTRIQRYPSRHLSIVRGG